MINTDLPSNVPTVAVYYQRSKAVQEEFKLIELTTERELVVSQLEGVIRDVKERRKELDDDTLLETFQLFNKIRDVTIRLLKAIEAWQISFTRPIRPTLLQCDYMIDKMIKYMDFVNASKVRKIFNFQLFRGNVLLLPFPNLKNDTPIKVGQALGREIKKFSSPPEEDVIAAYQVLINSLPEDVYQEKLVSLEKWLIGPWVPRIWIANTNKKFFTFVKPAPQHTSSQLGNAEENAAAKSKSTPTTNTKAQNKLPIIGGNANNNAASASKSQKGSAVQAGAGGVKQRRNQMLSKEATDILALTNSDGRQGNNLDELDAPLSVGDHEEIQQLELYYKELESMFLPKLGRRAVQTIVVGGRRMTSPLGKKRISLFSSLTSKAEHTSVEHALQGPNTAAFQRTDANLVAKRDRILQGRGEEGVQYQTHVPVHPPHASSNSLSLGNKKNTGEGTGHQEGEKKEMTGMEGGLDIGVVAPIDEEGSASLEGDSGSLSQILDPGMRPRRKSSAAMSSSEQVTLNTNAPPTPPTARTKTPTTPKTPSGRRRKKAPVSRPGSPLSLSTSLLRDWYLENSPKKD